MGAGPILTIAAAAMLLWTQDEARAQPAPDANWPCIQRKVEHLSLGLMWPHEIPDIAPDADQRDLIETLALRRVSIEEAEALVAAYAESHPGTDTGALGVIFSGVFARLDRDRTDLVQGIERYAAKQRELSERIDARRAEFAQIEAAEEPDFDRLDELEAESDWDERIFNDRAQSLTYVCESPVLIEQRVYAIAQTLLRHAP